MNRNTGLISIINIINILFTKSKKAKPSTTKRKNRKKLGKNIMIVGVILLFIGLFFSGIGIIIIPEAESVSELADDYDRNRGNFESYDDGDEIVIKGEITNEEEISAGGETSYAYELDDVENMIVYSGEDLGNEGDEIHIMVEVTSLYGVKLLEAQAEMQTPPIFYFGIIILIIGLIILIVGAVIKRRKKFARKIPLDDYEMMETEE